jgi:ABC-2 type transport system permease protein
MKRLQTDLAGATLDTPTRSEAPAVRAPLELHEVHGPSALGDDPERFRELLWIMAVSDFRQTYADTALGFLWSIVKPLVFFGLIFIVLRQVFNFGANIENFGLILVLGLVLFTYFQESTTRALRSVPARETIVRKMAFPRLVIPLSACLASAFTLLLNLISVLPLFVIEGVYPRPSWLLLLPLLVLLVAFSTGVGLILAVLYIRFEDVGQGWTLISRILFYATPVLYPLSELGDPFRQIASLNPLAALIEQARVWVIDPDMPGPSEIAGPVIGVVIPLILVTVVPIVGLWLFNRDAPRMAESL